MAVCARLKVYHCRRKDNGNGSGPSAAAADLVMPAGLSVNILPPQPDSPGATDSPSHKDHAALVADVRKLRSQLAMATEKWARDKQMFAQVRLLLLSGGQSLIVAQYSDLHRVGVLGSSKLCFPQLRPRNALKAKTPCGTKCTAKCCPKAMQLVPVFHGCFEVELQHPHGLQTRLFCCQVQLPVSSTRRGATGYGT